MSNPNIPPQFLQNRPPFQAGQFLPAYACLPPPPMGQFPIFPYQQPSAMLYPQGGVAMYPHPGIRPAPPQTRYGQDASNRVNPEALDQVAKSKKSVLTIADPDSKEPLNQDWYDEISNGTNKIAPEDPAEAEKIEKIRQFKTQFLGLGCQETSANIETSGNTNSTIEIRSNIEISNNNIETTPQKQNSSFNLLTETQHTDYDEPFVTNLKCFKCNNENFNGKYAMNDVKSMYGEFEKDQPTNERVYDRKTLVFIRDVVENTKDFIECPKTVNTNNKPISFNKSATKQRGTQLPPQNSIFQRQSYRSNKQYGGRFNADKYDSKNMNFKRPSVIKRSSSDGAIAANNAAKEAAAAPVVVRSAKAWKPKRADVLGETEDEIKLNLSKREIRSILNKITPSTFDEMSKSLLDYKIHENKPLMVHVIEVLFEKAVEEPRFCQLYAELCTAQSQTQDDFRRGIIKKCQKTFEKKKEEVFQDLKSKFDNLELLESEKNDLEEQMEAFKAKEKRRILGVVRFIGHLFLQGLIIDEIIIWCVIELLKLFEEHNEEEYVEYAIQFVQTVGPEFAKKNKELVWRRDKDDSPFDKACKHITNIHTRVSIRMKYLILNLDELRRNNWIPRVKADLPKKIGSAAPPPENKPIAGGGGGGGYNDFRQFHTISNNKPRGPKQLSGRKSDDRHSKNDYKARHLASGGNSSKNFDLIVNPDKLGKKCWKNESSSQPPNPSTSNKN